MHPLLADLGHCPYLPGRRFVAAVSADRVDADIYRSMLDGNCRRSGAIFYRPHCASCEACRTWRVDVDAFRPRRDQRRCAKRNADLQCTIAPRAWDDERRALYRRYQEAIHGDDLAVDADPELADGGGLPGCELHLRDATGRLLGVGCLDLLADAASSVYAYYDPDQPRRSLGTHLALCEIAHCRRTHRRWYYLGYLVPGCHRMTYKGRFAPGEWLVNGRWQRYDQGWKEGDTP